MCATDGSNHVPSVGWAAGVVCTSMMTQRPCYTSLTVCVCFTHNFFGNQKDFLETHNPNVPHRSSHGQAQ